jgi:hypothetical protein
MDLRASSLLLHNAPALAFATQALSTCYHHLCLPLNAGARPPSPPVNDFGTPGSPPELSSSLTTVLLLRALPLLPSTAAVASGCTASAVQASRPPKPSCDVVPPPLHDAARQALSAAENLETEHVDADVPQRAMAALAAACALLHSSDTIAKAAAADPIATACAAELALRAVAALQQLLPLICAAAMDPRMARDITRSVAHCLGAPCGDEQPHVSAFACARLVSLRAAVAAESAYKLAEAVSKGDDAASRLGSLYLIHLIIHAGQTSMLLFCQLGLGVRPPPSPSPLLLGLVSSSCFVFALPQFFYLLPFWSLNAHPHLTSTACLQSSKRKLVPRRCGTCAIISTCP